MSAVLSPCGTYRYRLDRRLGNGPTLAVVMVNPSTADAEQDDATIRKVKGFAERGGYGHVIVGNLFAFRATDVKELARTADPVGPGNDWFLADIMRSADAVLFAWGPVAKVPKKWRSRWMAADTIARAAGKTPLCLGVAQDGHPRHPLMLPYASPWGPWVDPLTCRGVT